jgi:hypothetical protein
MRDATRRSSNGIVRSAKTCVVSCPLPAITMASPARAHAIDLRDRGSTVLDHTRAAEAPEPWRPPLRSHEESPRRSSDRGLSDVRNTKSARSAAARPIPGRFARVAVAAAPEGDGESSRGEGPYRVEDRGERLLRVRVVDQNGETAAPDRPARGGRGRTATASMPVRIEARGRPRATAQPAAARRVVHVVAAGKRCRDLERAGGSPERHGRARGGPIARQRSEPPRLRSGRTARSAPRSAPRARLRAGRRQGGPPCRPGSAA